MIEVRPSAGDDERRAALAVRHAVFVEEQGVPVALEYDAHDPDAEHLVALHDREVIGTCRLLHQGETCKLGRMAVLPAARGRGAATALLALAETRARAAGATRMALSAQLAVAALYEQAGYTPRSDVYIEAGIDHIDMDKALHA